VCCVYASSPGAEGNRALSLAPPACLESVTRTALDQAILLTPSPLLYSSCTSLSAASHLFTASGSGACSRVRFLLR